MAICGLMTDVGANERPAPAVSADNLIQLDGSSSSDADGDKLAYRWRQIAGPQVQLHNSNTPRPYFYAEKDGRYTFELVVSDGKQSSAPALVSVDVEKHNSPPVAALAPSLRITLGEKATLDASASNDEDGDTLSYIWRQVGGPSDVFKEERTHTPQMQFYPAVEGVYTFELVVNDGQVGSKPVTATLEVVRPNTPPVARVESTATRVVISRNPTRAQTDASTPRAPVITMDELAQNNCPPAAPVAVARVAQQGQAASRPQAVENLAPVSAGARPVASTSGNTTAEIGERVVVRGLGVDPAGRELKYIWQQTGGPKLNPQLLGSSRDLSFIPNAEGVYLFELIVTNGSAVSEAAACAVTVVREHNSLLGLVGGDGGKLDSMVNEVEVPGVSPLAAGSAARRDSTSANTNAASVAANSDAMNSVANGNTSAPRSGGMLSRMFQGRNAQEK